MQQLDDDAPIYQAVPAWCWTVLGRQRQAPYGESKEGPAWRCITFNDLRVVEASQVDATRTAEITSP